MRGVARFLSVDRFNRVDWIAAFGLGALSMRPNPSLADMVIFYTICAIISGILTVLGKEGEGE